MKRELIFEVIKVCAKFNSVHSEVFPGYIVSSTELMRRISNAGNLRRMKQTLIFKLRKII